METKEMTKEEVFEFLKDTKILCTSKEESIKVQVALFTFGIEWISRQKGIDEDKYLLFINNKLEIQHTSDIDFWMDDVNKRIEPNEILAIQIKEEKQEQLNKNDMETKEMTKEEVFVYLNDTKIICTSTEESAKVQEKLFEFGIEWKADGKRTIFGVYLFYIINNNLKCTDSIEEWMRVQKKRIEPNEILAIQIKEEKPKFDPKTLQPFDKVLVKDDTIWYARFLDMRGRGEGEYQTTSGELWVDCIPYNEETKYLHGTTEEAPEFYRI